MKYSAKLYANAFAAVAAKPLKVEEEKKMVRNFLALIQKNGDTHQLPKILSETDRLMRKASGRRKVTVESARPLTPALLRNLSAAFQKHDLVETKLNPELVAGVKLTLDDETQYDGSLKRKLEKLFI